MEVYHGTKHHSAMAIMGPPLAVDVTKGGGELGRGFYAGTELCLAAAIAKGSRRALLKISIDDTRLAPLDIHNVMQKRVLITKWQELKDNKTVRTFLFGHDVVAAPFATIDFGTQYKFESIKAQNLLNTSTIIRVL